MRACVNCEGPGDDCFDPQKNPALKREIRAAKRANVPENYIRRVIQFAKQGYAKIEFPIFDLDWDSEAYLTVSGQNSNNSVRVTDEFLRAVEEDKGWDLTFRITGKIAKTLPARELWETIGNAAWQSADPGIQYHTTINDWHTCRADGEIIASNPCSEYMFLDDTACNLASMNLLQFRKEDGSFDTQAYEHAVRLWTIVLEISVVMAQFPSKEIALRSFDYRTLGLGYANIGGLLMTSGIPYNSPEGRAICGALSAIMTGVAYATSAEMAGELGAFPAFERNRDVMLRVMRNHARAARGQGHGYEQLATNPVPLDHANCRWREQEPHRARRRGVGARGQSRRGARLSQRAGDGDRADRHDRPRHGLRHDRHRARFRAGQIQEARRRRLLQDHQPRRAGGARDARLFAARDRGDRHLRGRSRHAERRAGDQSRHAEGQGLHGGEARRRWKPASPPPSTSSSPSTSGRSARISAATC